MNNLLGQRILIYQGSSKMIYAGTDKSTLVLHFIKRDDNDIWRNKISESIWCYLTTIGIDNHFLRTLNIREQLIRSVDVYQVFIKLHNISHTSLTERLGIECGTVFSTPLIEWHLKSKYINDPMISRDHIEYFQWLKKDEIKSMRNLAIRVNDILRALFYYVGIKPAVIELQFGVKDGKIILVGELSPETIVLWDDDTCDILNKDDAYNLMRKMPLNHLKII